MEVPSPPSCPTFVSVIFNEVKRSQLLQMVIEVVAVHAQGFLQLYGAHFIGLSQVNIGAATRWVGQSGGDGVAAHSSHSLTVRQERLLWFEDVVSKRINTTQFLTGK